MNESCLARSSILEASKYSSEKNGEVRVREKTGVECYAAI